MCYASVGVVRIRAEDARVGERLRVFDGHLSCKWIVEVASNVPVCIATGTRVRIHAIPLATRVRYLLVGLGDVEAVFRQFDDEQGKHDSFFVGEKEIPLHELRADTTLEILFVPKDGLGVVRRREPGAAVA